MPWGQTATARRISGRTTSLDDPRSSIRHRFVLGIFPQCVKGLRNKKVPRTEFTCTRHLARNHVLRVMGLAGGVHSAPHELQTCTECVYMFDISLPLMDNLVGLGSKRKLCPSLKLGRNLKRTGGALWTGESLICQLITRR